MLVTIGILEAYGEEADRAALRLAYLGLCLRGPVKPPHRDPHEAYILYGRRVYDHLIGLGADHHDVIRWSAEVLGAAISMLPSPPTASEVAASGESSTGGPSGTGSSSRTAGPVTPSGG